MKELNRDKILEILDEVILKTEFHVSRLALFGSFARNEANDKSDIDFLVEFDIVLDKYISNRQALIDYLKNRFQREVDVANPKSLKPFYKDRILKQAIYA